MFRLDRLPKCGRCGEGFAANESTLCVKCFKDFGAYVPAPIPEGKNTFGIEIECFGHEDIRTLAYYTGDGSIDPDWGCDYELHLCADYSKIHMQAIQLCQKLNELGAGVNDTCGMHVHFSLPPMNAVRDRVRDAFRSVENEVAKIFPNRFDICYVRPIDEDLLRDGWYNYRRARLRINRTVEIRIHEATLNPYVMHDWLCAVREIQKVTFDLIENKPTRRVRALQRGSLYGIMRTKAARRYIGSRLNEPYNSTLLEEYSF